MNGDVVFDPRVLLGCARCSRGDETSCPSNTEAVADEEVKYTVDGPG